MAPGTTVSMKLAQNGVKADIVNAAGCSPLTPPDSAEIVDKALTFPNDGVDVELREEPASLCERIKRSVGLSTTSTTVGTQTHYDPVVVEARTIFLDIWNLVKQEQPSSSSSGDPKTFSAYKPRSSASLTMYRVAGELLDKYSIVYTSVVAQLNLVDNDERIDYFAFRVVSDEVLDGSATAGQRQISWGRIVALYALFLQVARDCHKRSLYRAAFVVADFVGIYVGERIAAWVTKQGGWGALERTFPAEDHVDQKVWKGLLVTGIGLGMLATAIKAIR